MTETDKAKILLKHGFTSNKLVVDYEKSAKIKEMSKTEAQTITYYKTAYPFLKFLTESELDRICDKYGLIYAPVGNYKMPVPDKNLQDIDSAQPLKQIDFSENAFVSSLSYYGLLNVGIFKAWVLGLPNTVNERFSSFSSADRWLRAKFPSLKNRSYICNLEGCIEINKQGLFIAAPKSHFSLKGLRFDSKKGFFSFSKAEVKDPIVFRYVKGGVQIITKWGLEGEDPALQNEILN